MRNYKINLLILGSIDIKDPIKFNTDKELELGTIFNSDIFLKPYIRGMKISSTVRADTDDRALKVALLFVGKMVDILAIKLNMPLIVTDKEIKFMNSDPTVTAIVEPNEIKNSFELARILNLHEIVLAKALNWYRKGLYTEDPFDKFLAIWNSIVAMAEKYAAKNEKTDRGIINKIWDCLVTLWGEEEMRSICFLDGRDLINEGNRMRNNLAHALVPVEVNHVQEVLDILPILKNIAYKFIIEWSSNQLDRRLT